MGNHMKPYERITCINCQGHGQVSDYGPLGLDFEGPTECPHCGGSGTIVRYESGVLAAYPGGPLLGREEKPRPVTA